MNGTGPKPTAKLVTNNNVAMADRTLTLKRIAKASSKALMPMPAIERSKQAFLPSLSASGENAIVATRLVAETTTMRREAVVGRRSERSETEYMMILLIPQSCWANMTPTTATMALWWSGWETTSKMPTPSLLDFVVLEEGWRWPSEAWRRLSSSATSPSVNESVTELYCVTYML